MSKESKSARRGWVHSDVTLSGKTVLITGANTGIGYETALDLAKRNARVLLACRSIQKAEIAKNKIIEESASQNVAVKELDLASFESIRKLADDINATEDRLNILINNAGVFQTAHSETKDGFEMHFGVNYLGHFLLTNLLLNLLKRSAPSRVITLSSTGHKLTSIDWEDINKRKHYDATITYSQSKLMNVLFSRELSKRLEGTGVTSNSLHPGVVKTELDREAKHCCKLTGCLGCGVWCMTQMKCLMMTAEKGAQTSIYCAVAPELENVTGKYFSDCKIQTEAMKARNDDDARRLWDLGEELTGIQNVRK